MSLFKVNPKCKNFLFINGLFFAFLLSLQSEVLALEALYLQEAERQETQAQYDNHQQSSENQSLFSKNEKPENVPVETPINEAEVFFLQAEHYLRGSAGERSYPLAIQFFQKASDLNHLKAKERLTWLSTYLPNESSLKKRYRRQLQAAKENDKEAQFTVAEMCEFGLGVELNLERAIYWYKISAENNYGKAQNRLGELYANGTLKEERAANENQALLWIQSAAENNQAQAQFKLAEYYRFGKGGIVVPNQEQAFFWYQKSAENAHIMGQMQTAQMLKVGEGVVQNYEQALYWYKKALEQDYEPAREQVREINTLLDDLFLKNFK